MIDGCDEGMATPIDCRAYYIDSDSYATAKSSRASCQGLRHTGSGFSVSKYLIDRSGSETEQNSSELSASGCGDGENCAVQNVTNVAPNGVATAVATGNDVSTSGRAHRRSVRGRLRRVMGKLESFLTDMKVVYNFWQSFLILVTFYFNFNTSLPSFIVSLSKVKHFLLNNCLLS